ncbi:S-adenosyl-L-methionine-dependent methyltransferase [Aspergillus cavernicola]|uniref:S-adenosyl-L-methionine-dependent methyltransferase n=1 Tax=Aspergillus cavernicola TaxID=176166 RepID=A0ABR4IAD2_9EURO
MSTPSEKTFRAYTQTQGETYAQTRLTYHPSLYNTILTHHTTTGGALDTIIDVGCGPGTAVATLSQHFNHAIGLDPSAGMIAAARAINAANLTAASHPIRFEVSTAEDLGSGLSAPGIPDASVDLITAATAAHWFDMEPFWKSAARVLKPGGSVAIWASGYIRIHPDMANAEALQEIMDRFQEEYLREFFSPGNLLTRDLYRGLPLPWTVEPAVEGFGEGSFVRKDWETAEEFYAGGSVEVDLDVFERMIGTMSPVTRWREAHPGVEGTEGDAVRMFRREIERVFREMGVQQGEERIKGAVHGFLLVVKREA